jgi:hypothetical protein
MRWSHHEADIRAVAVDHDGNYAAGLDIYGRVVDIGNGRRPAAIDCD